MQRWRTHLGVSVFLLAWAGLVLAQEASTFEQIVVGSTAVGIASATTNPTGRQQMNTCSARLETAEIRFRDDGTDPTATTGTPMDDNDVLTITGNAVARRIRFIRSTGISGTLTVRCSP